jgi:hypothetical protein
VTLVNLVSLAIVLLFFLLMVGFSILYRRRRDRGLRDIPAFTNLRRAIDLSVEDGTRLHISIGRGDITGHQSAAALVGLSVLRRIAEVASESDKPPVATAGDGTLGLLAQDTLRSTYQSMGILSNYDNSLARVTGLTPFSYAAGTLPIIMDEDVSANTIIGSVGNEVALITTTGERSQTLTMAGADSIPSQAILYATAHEPLIGEEMYAAGAYIGAGPMHAASLHAQDVMRWLLVISIIIGTLLGFFR